MQNKCIQLENTLQKYKDYIENKWPKPMQQNQRFYRRPIRKTKYLYYQEINEDESSNDDDYDDDDYDNNNNNNQEIRYIKPKKK